MLNDKNLSRGNMVVRLKNWLKEIFIFPIVIRRARKKLSIAQQSYRNRHDGRDFTV